MLPEYRALRATAPDFLSFCLNPELAAEATLQPMRRFAYDAAIVFADILLIPMALGQSVTFEVGEGPRLGPLPKSAEMGVHVDSVATALSPVGETLRRVRASLETERALIGFAGGPWTVATYMVQGGGGDRQKALAMAYETASEIDGLIELLVESTAQYLAMQARCGAQALQIFESWAEGLAEDQFQRLVIGPHGRLITRLRQLGCSVPVIGFPRGAGGQVLDYAERVAVQAVGLDTQATARMGREIQRRVAIQGALDPLLLRAGGAALDQRVDKIVQQWSDGPLIFNLGHGILPDTPIAHVEQVLGRLSR